MNIIIISFIALAVFGFLSAILFARDETKRVSKSNTYENYVRNNQATKMLITSLVNRSIKNPNNRFEV